MNAVATIAMPQATQPVEDSSPARKRAKAQPPRECPDGRVCEEIAAEMIGVTPGTMRTWRYQLRGPEFVKVGARVWYYRDAVDLWMREHMQFVDLPADEC